MTALRIMRVACGLTQGELARLAGLSRATVNRLEAPAAPPPRSGTAQAIAEALGHPPRVVFPEEVTPGTPSPPVP